MQTSNEATTPERLSKSVDAVPDDWKNLAARIDGLGKGFTNVGNAADVLLDRLEKLGGRLGTGMGLFKTHIFEPGLDMGKLRKDLGDAMPEKDPEQIADLYKRLNAHADQYGMPFSGMVEAFTAMKGMRENDRVNMLKRAADLSAWGDIGVKEAAGALLEAQGAGPTKLTAILAKKGIDFTPTGDHQNPKDRQKDLNKIFKEQNIDGSAERKAVTRDGLITRLENFKNSFAGLVLGNGVLTMLEQQLKRLVSYLGELRDSEEFEARAKSVAEAFCNGLNKIIDVMESAGDSLKKVNSLLGGWENTVTAVIALLAMPVLAPLLSLTATLLGASASLIGAGAGMVAAGSAGGAGIAAANALGGIPHVAAVMAFASAVYLLADRLINSGNTPDEPYPGLPADDARAAFLEEYSREDASDNDMAIPGLTLDLRYLKTKAAKPDNPGLRLTPLTEAWPGVSKGPGRDDASLSGASARPMLFSSHPAAAAGRILPESAERLLAGSGREQTVRTEVCIKGENLPSCLTLSAGKTEAERITVENPVDRGVFMSHTYTQ